MGSFMHACEGEIVCESINEKIPYFNAPIYLENKVTQAIDSLCDSYIDESIDRYWKS